MSKYTYSEIKQALKDWDTEQTRWADNKSQTIDGIGVGYYHPSDANWNYQMYVEILTDVDGEQYLCETVRCFGQLEGIITARSLKYMVNLAGAK